MSFGLESQVEALNEMQSSGKAAEMREAVYKIISAGSGFTCREVGVEMNVEPHVVSARISELEKEGKVKKEGTKKCTVSGRNVTNYVAGDGFSLSGTRINMQMGVSFNTKINRWVVYFDGRIIANEETFGGAGKVLKKAYTSAKGL